MPQARHSHRVLVITCAIASVQICGLAGGAPASAQTADGWEIEFAGGLGDSTSIIIASLEEFEGTLYAGTFTSGGCKILARGVYPLRSAWGTVTSGGWGDSSNSGATAMETFTYTLVNPIAALYVGTVNFGAGAEVWQYNQGAWHQTNSNGFGNSHNFMITDMEVFNDNLFAATGNSTTGAELWSFSGITWFGAMTGGFGTSGNSKISSLAVFAGKLYASTENPNGGDIWESPDGLGWSRTVPAGFFDGSDGSGVMTLAEAGGNLYALVDGSGGIRSWQVAPGTPMAVNTGGFGDSANLTNGTMVAFRDELYVGTQNSTTGCEIWRLRGGAWTQENTDGFGSTDNTLASSMVVFDDRLVVGTVNTTNGAEVWRLPVLLADGFESGGFQGWTATLP